jgi:hypothetical protein
MLLFYVSLCYCILFVIHFIPLINLDQWYQSCMLFIYFSSCMSPIRSGYKKLGLEPIEPLQDQLPRARQQPMGDKKKDDGAGDPFKMLFEEALVRQRNEMMDNFAQILQLLPTGDASSSSIHATPFKVQVNFDIPLFEGLIHGDVVDKWLNLLEGYFSVHNFFDRENITFALLKVVPHVKDCCDTYSEQRVVEESTILVITPTWDLFRDAIKEQYYCVGSYEDQYTRWSTLRQERDQTVPDFTNIFHTPCTKLGIKDSK